MRLAPDRSPRTSGRGGCGGGQLQPLVLPQLGQAWHEPARIIGTPHCMHIGASCVRITPRAGVLSTGVGATVPERIWSASSPADGTDFGSAAISRARRRLDHRLVDAGQRRLQALVDVKMPSSARSS